MLPPKFWADFGYTSRALVGYTSNIKRKAACAAPGVMERMKKMGTIPTDAKSFAKLIDTSMLRPTNLEKEYVALCEEAVQYGFACAAVSQCFVKLCAEHLKGSDVRLTSGPAFPYGLSTLKSKLCEISNAFEDGATDADMLLNTAMILDHKWDFVEEEMKAMVELCNQNGKLSKIIFENSYLNEEEIRTIIKIANGIGPNFLKCGTGTQGPATKEVVALMRKEADPKILVKASGDVQTCARVEEVVLAGADRIGTTNAGTIMKQYLEKYPQ